MITLIRTAAMMPAKTAEAMAFAHQVSELCEKKTGIKVSVNAALAGNAYRLAWISTTPDLAATESAWAKLLNDQESMSLVESVGAPCFLPGSVQDEYWYSV